MVFKKKKKDDNIQEEVKTETGREGDEPDPPIIQLTPEEIKEINGDIRYHRKYLAVHSPTEIANTTAVQYQAETMNLLFGILAELRKLRDDIKALNAE